MSTRSRRQLTPVDYSALNKGVATLGVPQAKTAKRCSAKTTKKVDEVQGAKKVDEVQGGDHRLLGGGDESALTSDAGEGESCEEGSFAQHGGGLYFPGKEDLNNTEAQIVMIEETLKWAEVENVKHLLDVGCGIGGSSRYLSNKYQCTATGITLSPKQAQRGNEINSERGVSDNVKLQVADALDMPFQSSSFDLVWSLESGEHMPDKKKFVSELCRVVTPGGRIIIVTWCYRVLQPGQYLSSKELDLLERINEAYYLPKWCSVADYEKLLQDQGMTKIKSEDWSDYVAPFWGKVIESALTPQGVTGLLSTGWDTIKGALVMPLMSEGYRMGLIKFVLVTAVKKDSQ